jgi:TRAP-type mannitol/chloroaromatic compound transport system permease large subunit
VKLYAGAFFPASCWPGSTSLYGAHHAAQSEAGAAATAGGRNVPFATVIWALIVVPPLCGLIAAALGSIVFGLATPSEAAAMGSLGALLLAVSYGADYSRRWALILIQIYGVLAGAFLIYLVVCGFTAIAVDRRIVAVALFATLLVGIVLIPITKFSLNQLKESVFLTARTTAMVCWLFIGSFCFSAVFAYRRPRADRKIRAGDEPVVDRIHDPCADHYSSFWSWLEWTEIIVIFMPIFLPLLKTFDVDPLFFGLLVALNIRPRSCRCRWRWRRSI